MTARVEPLFRKSDAIANIQSDLQFDGIIERFEPLASEARIAANQRPASNKSLHA